MKFFPVLPRNPEQTFVRNKYTQEKGMIYARFRQRHCCPNPLYVVSQQYRETSILWRSLQSFAMSLLVMMRSPCHHRRSNVQAYLRRRLREFWNLFSRLQVLDISLTCKLGYVDACSLESPPQCIACSSYFRFVSFEYDFEFYKI
jgi:hypothetical protein